MPKSDHTVTKSAEAAITLETAYHAAAAIERKASAISRSSAAEPKIVGVQEGRYEDIQSVAFGPLFEVRRCLHAMPIERRYRPGSGRRSTSDPGRLEEDVKSRRP